MHDGGDRWLSINVMFALTTMNVSTYHITIKPIKHQTDTTHHVEFVVITG